MRRHTWHRFMEIAMQAAACLRLTNWEKDFLVSLMTLGEQTQGEAWLSDKRLTVLLRLEDRMKVQQVFERACRHPEVTAWEMTVISDLAESGVWPSDKQMRFVAQLADKVTAPAEAAPADAKSGG